MSIYILAFWFGAFILGGIPFGLVLARAFAGVDLRREGSGNIGATNVARTLGLKIGIATLLLDVAKGLIPVLAAETFFQQTGEGWDAIIPAGAGLSAFLGHIYTPFLRFKGGKGVATALGVYLGSVPLVLVPVILVFAGVVALSGYVSAGSLTATLVAPVLVYFFHYPAAYTVMTLAMTVFIFWRHRENIGRLLRGEELKWRKGQRDNPDPTARQE